MNLPANHSHGHPNDASTIPILIMAGGLGTRLRPLTIDEPKPMVKIAGKPLLEIMIERVQTEGFRNILISVNYRKEVIQSYFGDGEAFGVGIRYVEESERLGTAGSVHLAKEMLNQPFFVMNGDILTTLPFRELMDFHKRERNAFTIASAEHAVQVPYGVVEQQGRRVTEIREKPTIRIRINAGIYCLNPELISLIPQDHFYDMNQLIEKTLAEKLPVGNYNIHDYWLDVGRMTDYRKANEDYRSWFGEARESRKT